MNLEKKIDEAVVGFGNVLLASGKGFDENEKIIAAQAEATQALTTICKEYARSVCMGAIGDDEKIKDVKNRSILDSPKVKVQNLYRVDRNALRASQRAKAVKAIDQANNTIDKEQA